MSRIDAIREHAIQGIHRMVESHWPAEDGRCPICQRPGCWVLREVGETLAPQLLGWQWAGPFGPTAATSTLVRGAVSPPASR